MAAPGSSNFAPLFLFPNRILCFALHPPTLTLVTIDGSDFLTLLPHAGKFFMMVIPAVIGVLAPVLTEYGTSPMFRETRHQ